MVDKNRGLLFFPLIVTWKLTFNTFLFTGLCADCSDKLNYKHQKREIKRSKKRKYQSQLVLDDDAKVHLEPEVQLSEEQPKKVKEETLDDEISAPLTETTSATADDEGNIWKTANRATEEKSREDDFEEFLEQLLL